MTLMSVCQSLLEDPTVAEADLSAEVGLALRACLIYSAGLVIVRIGKNRLLGRTTAFDIVLAFILGSLFSRAINGTAPVLGTIVAAITLVVLHWLIAELTRRWGRLEMLLKGRHLQLIEDGKTRTSAMRRAEVSENDLLEALRLHGGTEDPERVRRAYLERNGEISVLPRAGPPQVVEVDVKDGVQTIRVVLDPHPRDGEHPR